MENLGKDMIRLLLFHFIWPSDVPAVLATCRLFHCFTPNGSYTKELLIRQVYFFNHYMAQSRATLGHMQLETLRRRCDWNPEKTARALRRESHPKLNFTDRHVLNAFVQCTGCAVLVKRKNVAKHRSSCKGYNPPSFFGPQTVLLHCKVFGKDLVIDSGEALKACPSCRLKKVPWDLVNHYPECHNVVRKYPWFSEARMEYGDATEVWFCYHQSNMKIKNNLSTAALASLLRDWDVSLRKLYQ